jgi:sarcosine oxidase subunit gamma
MAADVLAGVALAGAHGIAALRAVPECARFSLRMRPEHAAAIAAARGLSLPERISRFAGGGSGAALTAMLGPDEWLIWASRVGAERVAAPLVAAPPHALVDVSDRFAGLVVEGPSVEDVLASGCPLPLDPERFAPGRATRTIFHRAEIILLRTDERTFRLECGRSFLPYVADHLGEAIRHEAALRR